VDAQSGQEETNITLTPTSGLASQLTGAEWLESMPGTKAQKSELYRCEYCHTLQTVVRSHYTAAEWPAVLKRMQGWLPPSTQELPIPNRFAPNKGPVDAVEFGTYLASINLSGRDKWPFELHAFPRPSGKNARVIITEYDLPRANSYPHDAAVAPDGRIWYDDFQQPYFGVLDPRSGQTREWKIPILRPEDPGGLLTIKVDKAGKAWMPRFKQGCTLTVFDPKSETFKSWTVDPKDNNAKSSCAHVALGAPDDIVWFSDSENRRMYKLNTATGHIDGYNSFPSYKGATGIVADFHNTHQHRTYGIGTDSKGNGYFADIAGGNIGRVDVHTGNVTLFPTPTPNSGPRRTFMDSQDRYWFGENYASKIGMFDTRSNQMKEWTPPVPWSGCYPAVVDRNADVWTDGMSTDYVYRLNPSTGEFTYYLLPTLGANLRRIDADNSTNPVTIWVSEVHRGKLAKIEPLQ
jgi:virginiamycin B lyase